MTEKEFKTGKKSKKSSALEALKDFKCQFNNTQVNITKGDDVSKLDLPEWVKINLVTEGVLKG